MYLITNQITTLLTYIFLYLTVIFLWVPHFKRIPLWSLMLGVSILFGLISKRIELISVVFILLLACFAYFLQNIKISLIVRILSAVGLLILGCGLALHIVPGFHNLQVLDKVKISEDGIPFSLYLNFDKTIVGIFILGILHQLITTKNEWIKMFKGMTPGALVLILIIACLSFLFHYVRFDPKLPSSLLIWSCTNLLFVCVAEEGFFRGFIQKYLCLVFQNIKYGNLLAISIASILFGLAHYTGGVLYVLLAFIAGMGYGFIYFRTKRIESSIITHFLLNLIHFLFFTYPALASAIH